MLAVNLHTTAVSTYWIATIEMNPMAETTPVSIKGEMVEVRLSIAQHTLSAEKMHADATQHRGGSNSRLDFVLLICAPIAIWAQE